MTRPPHRLWLALAAAGALAAPGACASVPPPPPAEVTSGDPVRGAELIGRYGCGTCHEVPGVRGADGMVGPPLTRFGSRSYIAGHLVNTGPNLWRWITDPQGVDPGTAMPDVGVTDADARDIVAYLMSLD
ncbi:c-type cytochrome [Phytohabitans kaempferiae]|uniref:C-type cytochrome n=1 Tax=Phytohabitans kaempferiae TaxID=1620943 RepID=A0ABV6MAH3_9ACTN